MRNATQLLPGTWLVELNRFEDARGSFVKTFSASVLAAALPESAFDLREEFYSVSYKDVIRGMHFQRPPHDHIKLVYCPIGAVLDVLLDLRSGPGYGKHAAVRLEAQRPQLLWIPSGIAHGFLSLSDESIMVYKTSTEHAPAHDAGVRYDSFGFDWGITAPIVSDRDRTHPVYEGFISPF